MIYSLRLRKVRSAPGCRSVCWLQKSNLGNGDNNFIQIGDQYDINCDRYGSRCVYFITELGEKSYPFLFHWLLKNEKCYFERIKIFQEQNHINEILTDFFFAECYRCFLQSVAYQEKNALHNIKDSPTTILKNVYTLDMKQQKKLFRVKNNLWNGCALKSLKKKCQSIHHEHLYIHTHTHTRFNAINQIIINFSFV